MNTENIKEYLEFIKENKSLYQANEVLEVVTDPATIEEYCAKNNARIGVVYRSKHNIMVVDLVRNKAGRLFAYERIVKTVSGNSVVIMPFLNGKILLLKQFRHALGEYQLAFPRGYGEENISPEENARKEISEELNCNAENISYLGRIVADSGVCGEMVCAFQCSISLPAVDGVYEDIASFITVTEDEFCDMAKKGLINDSFTLSTFMLYRSKAGTSPL